MKKTLAEFMNEPVNMEEIIRSALAINKLIEDSTRAGAVCPELEDETTKTDDDENIG